MAIKIPVVPNVFLTEIRRSDRDFYVEYFKDLEIYNNTLRIPYPYTTTHADEWIELNEKWFKDGQPVMNFAIRDESGIPLGGAGFHQFEPGKSHKAELGYWLAKKFWGKGIMTAVVSKLSEMGFKEFGLIRIEAIIFATNAASQTCLEKNGYQYEGFLKSYYQKDGKLIDAKVYAKLKQKTL